MSVSKPLMASDSLETILAQLDGWRERARDVRELLLANAVMLGEMPAPTGAEEKRRKFLLDRFIEAECSNTSTDEAGNAMAILPGEVGEHCILVSAHLDTPFPETVDHTITVTTDGICGPGILDNALGVAAIATLPWILKRLGVTFDDNLLLMGSSKSLGVGDMEGMRFFLNHNTVPLRAGLLVEGGTLGRLSYSALGLLRAEIHCNIPTNYDFSEFGASGAIPVFTRLIQRLRRIRLPREPRTSMIFGSLEAGKAFNSVARKGRLRFEIRSEEAGMVAQLLEEIEESVEEIRQETKVELTLSIVAKRKTGALQYSHPLVRSVRSVMKRLDIDPTVAPSTGELAALLSRDIPGVTLGLTNGERRHEIDERIEIEPLFAGIAQLVAVLKAIDGGLTDAND